MRRLTIATSVLALVLAMAGSTSVASAAKDRHGRTITIGNSDDQDTVAPTCPDNCLVITRTSGYNRSYGSDSKASVNIPIDGRIVAVTFELGNPTKKQRKQLTKTYGGPARAQLAVVRQKGKLRTDVKAITPEFKLTPFFGSTVQFPLAKTLKVEKGDKLAISVRTWAPLLAAELADDNSWRSSRPQGDTSCNNFLTQTAQLDVGDSTTYGCLYSTARLTYTATEMTTPKAPSDKRKKRSGKRRGKAKNSSTHRHRHHARHRH